MSKRTVNVILRKTNHTYVHVIGQDVSAAPEEIPTVPQRVDKSVSRKIRVKKSAVPAILRKKMLDSRERSMRALELRKAGVTYAVIADQLGYSHASAAKKAVDRAILRQEFEAARDVVLMDLVRLDEFQMRLTEALRTKGDLRTIDQLLRVMEMRYRLIGVSARTVEELQEHFGIKNVSSGITNNGVMVIQGSQADFVRSMMTAVGVDPDSPAAKKKLRELEAAPKSSQKGSVQARTVAGSTGEPDAGTSHTELEEDDIIDAEIVDE